MAIRNHPKFDDYFILVRDVLTEMLKTGKEPKDIIKGRYLVPSLGFVADYVEELEGFKNTTLSTPTFFQDLTSNPST